MRDPLHDRREGGCVAREGDELLPDYFDKGSFGAVKWAETRLEGFGEVV